VDRPASKTPDIFIYEMCVKGRIFSKAFLANTAFYKLCYFQRVIKLLQFSFPASALSAMTTWHYDPHLATKEKWLALKILRLGFFYGGPSNKIKVNFTDAILYCGCQFEFSIRGHLLRDLEPKHHRGQSSELRNSWEHPAALPCSFD